MKEADTLGYQARSRDTYAFTLRNAIDMNLEVQNLLLHQCLNSDFKFLLK